jgi:hypothetical protein
MMPNDDYQPDDLGLDLEEDGVWAAVFLLVILLMICGPRITLGI